MKLSICTGELELRFGLERSFEMIKNAGFDALDFNLDGYWDGAPEQVRKMRCYGMSEEEMREYFGKISEYAKAYELSVGQTHSIYGNPGFREHRETFMNVTVKNIFQTHLLGCHHTVIHPVNTTIRTFNAGKDEYYKINLEFYRSLIPYLDKSKLFYKYRL